MGGIKELSPGNRKRKLDDGPALEIDLSAPEPPSKKALRKAKKNKKKPTKEHVEAAPTGTESKELETSEAAEKPAKQQRSTYGIWIGNLPFFATKDDLRNFFSGNGAIKGGAITRVHMPEGPKQNRKAQNKGFAYVDFSTKEAMDQAIALSEQLLSGRRVLIKSANDFEGRPDKPADRDAAKKGPVNPPSQKIFVGNLSYDVTKEMLEGHFAPCGTVSNIHMATFEDSGKCKGYAWVEFEDIEAAKAAVRGFVEVDESDGEEEEEEESSDSSSDSSSEESESEDEEEKTKSKSKAKKTKKNVQKKQKRVWVNRIAGRQMRMEFAEDKATRYKKLFGKEGSGKDRSTEGKNGAEEDAAPIEEVPGNKSDRPGKKGKGEKQSYRYSKDVVQRMSGAMVEGQGKKTTFD